MKARVALYSLNQKSLDVTTINPNEFTDITRGFAVDEIHLAIKIKSQKDLDALINFAKRAKISMMR